MRFNPGNPIIEIERADVHNSNSLVLHDLSLTIRKGENLAVIGPNGAGKTSLIQLITCRLHPVYREAPPPRRVFGRDRWNFWELHRHLGVITPDVELRNRREITGRQAVLSGFFNSIGLHQQPTKDQLRRGETIIERLGIKDLAGKYVSHMSTGEARLCMIGRALVHEPDALLLDEPTSGLDVKAAAHFLSMLRLLVQNGTTLIMTTHHVDDIIPEVNRLALLKDGTVVALGAKEALLTSETLSSLFDAHLRVEEKNGLYRVTLEK